MDPGLWLACVAALAGTAPLESGDSLNLRLNLPSFRLEVRAGPERLRDYPVAVGDSAWPTPRGVFSVTRVEWDPWWVPPASEWARADTITPPGPRNPMGRVKLYFQELYFIHGTPDPRSLGRPASHGCIRVSNSAAVELAVLIQEHGSSIDSATLASLAAGRGRTRVFTLDRPVPLEIRYEVAAIEGEHLVVLPDIYRLVDSTRVAPALAALRAAGFDTTTVFLDSLRALIPANRMRRASIPLTRLVPTADFRP